MKNLNEELYFIRERLEKEQIGEEFSIEKTRKTLRKSQEEILEKREKTSTRELVGGSNTTIFVELKDDGSGVFKPRIGEIELRKNVKAGTYFKRERASYIVDQFLGFDLVPPTVIRKVDGKKGSLQEFIPDSKVGGEYRCDELDKDELAKLWIFDYIIFNSDRHSGNFLVKKKKIYAIDNGLAFGEDILDTYGSIIDVPIQADIRKKIEDFLSSNQTKKVFKQLLSELINKEEVEACMNRIKNIGNIIKDGVVNEKNRGEFSFNPTN